jgi:hypothetical protein
LFLLVCHGLLRRIEFFFALVELQCEGLSLLQAFGELQLALLHIFQFLVEHVAQSLFALLLEGLFAIRLAVVVGG